VNSNNGDFSASVLSLSLESESHCDWRSVNLSVLVSSPVWGSWPDSSYCLTVTVLSLGGGAALSDERLGLSFFSLSAVISQLSICSYIHFTCFTWWHTYTIYTRPLTIRAQYSRLCPISGSFSYNGSLVTWTVVCLAATKFKPLVFSVRGFALSNGANVFISQSQSQSQSQSHIATDGFEPHLGLMTRYLLLFDNYGLGFVGRPLWQEDGSVFNICCWPSPA
jgi:hypothetical protein